VLDRNLAALFPPLDLRGPAVPELCRQGGHADVVDDLRNRSCHAYNIYA
jgi:hypothetical protein